MIHNKLSIRPIIKKIGSTENKGNEEKFQNETLRPIIKLQHDLLIAFFDHYTSKKKIDFVALSEPKKRELIAKVFKNDTQFKTELRGLIIGHFTVEEYSTYQNMATEINRRIATIIKERLLSII